MAGNTQGWKEETVPIAGTELKVIQGGSGSFTVTVDQQSAFQWRFGAVNIPGATSASYTLTNAQPGDAGPYHHPAGSGNAGPFIPLLVDANDAVVKQPHQQNDGVQAAA